MSSIKSSNKNCINQHKYKKRILEMKKSARGRQIIKPKRLLTSSDDKQERRKRIIKCKSTDVLQEFKKDLQSHATQPNILRDITSASNTQKIKRVTSETPHKASQVVSCSEPQDISSPCNNHNVNYNTNVLSTKSLSNKENAQFINNVADISEMDNCQSVSDYVYENTENNKHNSKNTPTILDIESLQIPIVFQKSGKIKIFIT